jgi:hypothetical protein
MNSLVFHLLICALAFPTAGCSRKSEPAPDLESVVRSAAERNLTVPSLGPEPIRVFVAAGQAEQKIATLENLALSMGGSASRVPSETPGEHRLFVRIGSRAFPQFRNGVLGLPVESTPAPGTDSYEYCDVVVVERSADPLEEAAAEAEE